MPVVYVYRPDYRPKDIARQIASKIITSRRHVELQKDLSVNDRLLKSRIICFLHTGEPVPSTSIWLRGYIAHKRHIFALSLVRSVGQRHAANLCLGGFIHLYIKYVITWSVALHHIRSFDNSMSRHYWLKTRSCSREFYPHQRWVVK